MTHEVDVVVVGAGAAGLAAGRRLQDAGLSFEILEARPRSGGRSWTDIETFNGVGFDRGCHWLHSASINPLRAEADRLDVAYHHMTDWRERRVFDGTDWLDEEGLKNYDVSLNAAFKAIHDHGDNGRDIASAEAIDPSSSYLAAIRLLHTLMTSAEIEEVSVLDQANYEDTEEDYPVKHGYGALIQRIAQGIPVTLETPANTIDWTDNPVVIETPRGSIRATAVIVTASTNVLANEGIRFSPNLPQNITEVLHATPTGSAEKVAFLLDRHIEGEEHHSYAMILPHAGDALNFQIMPFGAPIAIAHFGGDVTRTLTREGEAAMIAYARERFTNAYGGDTAKTIREATATNWTVDPYIQGAYSYALPGKAGLRPRLAESFSDRLFLAGEATSANFFSTAHGAHITGIRAAERAIAALASR